MPRQQQSTGALHIWQDDTKNLSAAQGPNNIAWTIEDTEDPFVEYPTTYLPVDEVPSVFYNIRTIAQKQASAALATTTASLESSSSSHSNSWKNATTESESDPLAEFPAAVRQPSRDHISVNLSLAAALAAEDEMLTHSTPQSARMTHSFRVEYALPSLRNSSESPTPAARGTKASERNKTRPNTAAQKKPAFKTGRAPTLKRSNEGPAWY